MKSQAILFSLLALFALQCVDAQTDKEIHDLLRERVEVAKVNQSIAAAVIDENGTRFISFGKMNSTPDAKRTDENTVFEIGSITKVFTGILLAEAVKRGEVKLNDPVSKYLPDTVKMPSRNGREITLLDLTTHTSGLPSLPTNFKPADNKNPYADYSVQQMYEFLSGYTLTRDIGEQSAYSNLGVGLLGHVLALKAGRSYEELVKARILMPLGMKDTSIILSPEIRSRTAQGFTADGEPASLWDLPTLAGAGALRSTAKDMAKFIAANMHLTKSGLTASFDVSHKPQRDVNAKMKVGMGWHIMAGSTGDIIWHNGGTGGFRTYAGFSPTLKRGIVVLSNSSVSVDDIGFHSFDPLFPLTKMRQIAAVSETTLDEYVGNYELAPNVVFSVTRQAEKLFAELPGQPRIRLYPESESKFFVRGVDAQVTFNRGTDAKVESLTLHQGGDRVARRIK
jgi:CubicO group peptidase (beta-lactamase class C family)